MSEMNKQAVTTFLAAQARGDTAVLHGSLTDDFVWHVPGKNLVSRDYHGPEEALGFLARVRELSNGTARPQLLDVLASENYVTVLVRMFAEREGRKLEGSFQAWVYRIAGGKIAEIWFLVEDRYEVDAFWL
jgi:ketosteroid isomerase-like protein